MESSTERFFKGFSLEDYRHQVFMKSLEKEKRQCLDRLREETHVFKMSIKPPVKCQEECWSQYGEIFHANGDKRGTGSITHINIEGDVNEDTKTSNTSKPFTDRQIQTPSKSIQNCNEMNRIIQRRNQQRIRNKGQRNKDSKKKTKPAGLTLLEILCGEFENGTLLGKRTERIQEKNESVRDCCASNVKHGRTKKAQTAGEGQELLLTDSEKSLKLAKEASSKARSYTSKSSCEVFQSGHGESEGNLNCNTSVVISKIADTEGFYSSDSPKESSASEMGISSEETVALRGRSAQNLNSTSEDLIIKNHKIELENQTTRRQLCEGIHSKLRDRSASIATTTKIERGSPILSSNYPSRLTESSLGVKTPESCRFVHFKERRNIWKRKSKKGNCVEKSRGKEKLNRTRSLGVKLFQFDGLQSPQKGVSKEEIENETRQKMDQFFAKVEHTKTCQTSTPRWRCTSGVDSSARKAERKIAVEQGKSSRGQEKKERGYRRAKPWPTQVWT